MPDSYLQGLVTNRCRELGPDKGAEFFDVSPGLVRQWLAGSKSPSLAAVEKVFSVPDGPPAEAGWNGREVFLALPFYKTSSPRVLWSLLGIWDRSKFRASMQYDDAYVIHTREALADTFLKTDVPFCWWVDSDVVSPLGAPGWFNKHTGQHLAEQFAGLHTPTRLRSHGKSIVSGVYFNRHAGGRAQYHEALVDDKENERAHAGPTDEIQPAQWAGLGCLLHSREVLLDIQRTHPHLASPVAGEPFHFFSPASDAVMREIPQLEQLVAGAEAELRAGTGASAEKLLREVMARLAEASKKTQAESRLQAGEDQTFGRRAAVAGHTTFVDHAIYCGHVGDTVFTAENTKG
jgi:hypothetical protein